MKELGKIIPHVPLRMREMLESVHSSNSGFSGKLLEKILFAMSIVDRKFFIEIEGGAYGDYPLPIGKGQTISQPSTVARMLLLAELQEGDDVLEIGAGSGWNACLTGFLVYPGNVTGVDRIASLIEKSQRNIAKLKNHLKQTRPQDVERISKISFLAENAFSKGKIWKRKYNKIIITAGMIGRETENKIEEMAQSLLKQDGILICPYVSGPLIIYKKKGKLRREETKEHYVFVPLLDGVEERK